MKSQTQKFQFSSGSIKYLKANRCEAYPSGMPNTETELEKKKKHQKPSTIPIKAKEGTTSKQFVI